MPAATCAFLDPASRIVHLRHPKRRTAVCGSVRLRERAIATSGIYLFRAKDRTSLREPNTGRTHRSTVRAYQRDAWRRSDCMTADALTKIVFALRVKSRGLTGAVSCRRIVARARWRAIMDVSFTMRHPRPDSIRLKRLHRYFLYAVLALLFLSGVAWAYWNYLVCVTWRF